MAEQCNKIKVGFYQFKPIFGEKEKNFEKVLSAIETYTYDIDLLVLPEFFATGYQFISKDEVEALAEKIPGGDTTEYLLGISYRKGIYVVAGLPEKDKKRFFNSAVLIGPEGFIGVYRKTHLFFEEKLYFTSGDTGFKVWDTKIGKIGIIICFDWFFPESMRSLALLGAEIVAHPSNLVLPYCPKAMPVRCLENKVFAITANRIGTEYRKKNQPLNFIGQSLIVSPAGEVLVKASKNEEVLITVEIEPKLSRNKSLNKFNNIFKDRRTDLYRKLIQ